MSKCFSDKMDNNSLPTSPVAPTIPSFNFIPHDDCFINSVCQYCDAKNIKISTEIIVVSVRLQEMFLFINKKFSKKYIISTSKNSPSQAKSSFGTPLGVHEIACKIGYDANVGEIFTYRSSTGRTFYELNAEEIYSKNMITSRILRLSGLENGVNFGGDVDSFSRCMYIHGVNREDLVGIPVSNGCINMKNIDVIELFELVNVGCLVCILAG